MLDLLIDFIFPKICVGCGEIETFLCKDCLERLDFVDQLCPMCGEGSPMGWTHSSCRKPKGMDGLIAIYEYKEPIMRSVVEGVKFGFNKELIKIVLKDFEFEIGEKFDFLVPIPLHFYRENWRGFNQAEEIAKEFGRQINLPIEKVLKRIRRTKQQALLKTKEEREENIKQAFAVEESWKGKLKGNKILLVDDVFTSGADMRECTRVLKKAGVVVVWGLVLAH